MFSVCSNLRTGPCVLLHFILYQRYTDWDVFSASAVLQRQTHETVTIELTRVQTASSDSEVMTSMTA
jgi:hypothetical protein